MGLMRSLFGSGSKTQPPENAIDEVEPIKVEGSPVAENELAVAPEPEMDTEAMAPEAMAPEVTGIEAPSTDNVIAVEIPDGINNPLTENTKDLQMPDTDLLNEEPIGSISTESVENPTSDALQKEASSSSLPPVAVVENPEPVVATVEPTNPAVAVVENPEPPVAVVENPPLESDDNSSDDSHKFTVEYESEDQESADTATLPRQSFQDAEAKLTGMNSDTEAEMTEVAEVVGVKENHPDESSTSGVITLEPKNQSDLGPEEEFQDGDTVPVDSHEQNIESTVADTETAIEPVPEIENKTETIEKPSFSRDVVTEVEGVLRGAVEKAKENLASKISKLEELKLKRQENENARKKLAQEDQDLAEAAKNNESEIANLQAEIDADDRFINELIENMNGQAENNAPERFDQQMAA